MDKKIISIEAKQGSSIEVKRFYVDGCIEQNCPNCKDILKHDLSQNYLSYPTIGEEIVFSFWCKKCDIEFEMKTIFKSLKLEFEEIVDTDEE